MMNAIAFQIWLSGAALGDELVYHCGDLSADTDPDKGRHAEVLNELLSAVLAELDRGRVQLRQGDARQHIARRIS